MNAILLERYYRGRKLFAPEQFQEKCERFSARNCVKQKDSALAVSMKR
jgi:hypothetical protein